MNVTAEIVSKETAPYLSAPALAAMVRKYDPSVSTKKLERAYRLCMESHGKQMRHSGDPYYAHPIAVAQIAAQLRMDTDSICTALLHDVLEDTDTTEDDMRSEFGDVVTDLVKGVTKLGQLELSSTELSPEDKQAENFQKFVLAMSKDIRVLLVKLCDRLHNMRTLQYHPKASSRERISRETMEIYAPLARKIGVDRLCSELEDLSFKFLNPSAYESINKRLSAWRESQDAAISQLSIMLRDVLGKNKVNARIYGREKRPFAIWRKLQRQGIAFEDVADIYAFRIIVDDVSDCYEVLGLLHREWRCVPARFRDFISVPKPNGYQSLHTTILGPDNQRVEVQIRTQAMDDIAERGVAAHWSYKNKSYSYDESKAGDIDPLHRIRPLVEMMGHGGEADEFMELAKLEMYADQVFTFTPKNKLIALPQGATPLDFAYAVHTKVGDTCIGAIINGRERPLRTQLQNGDVVKIIRGGTPEPTPGWESMVVTGKARSALRRLTRTGESQEFRSIGYMLVDHAFAREDKEFSETILRDTLKRLNFDTVDDLYIALGRGKLSVGEFMDAVFPGRKHNQDLNKFENRDLIDDNTAKFYVKGEGLREGVGLHLGECCYPIPGDRIVGIHTKEKGIVIHTIDCDLLAELENEPDSWLDLAWRRGADNTASIGQITATIEHVPGALAAIATIIGEAGGNLTNIHTLKRSPSFFDMVMDIEVTDAKHLSQIVAAMRASAYVVTVRRARANTSEGSI
ncbi:MAG: bifunctional (p)ppGpp synthetase/guanosine-3',5'-bis(diphosphate) 3'-pyrophosphohydrolase [Acidimicrobiales bacterium]|nr:bifunctional (p)ppGpp synthetase/guanosine-3',5'-bis(diphosphate) 3'-pyrophosphohydrolase [Hyphomonadaceae bacterium]RZV42814.1 MAG: bifunctional (p)ppGpp synthetase/guanosine-3',5'-bis(diphosphate) 3'-pyrophosphohydrolase [Acidimicrobiales bacterium]